LTYNSLLEKPEEKKMPGILRLDTEDRIIFKRSKCESKEWIYLAWSRTNGAIL
jgi:hypothetical protein